jgi:hypothetical protein
MAPMKKKLLIIADVWPEPKSTAAGIRMLQLINFFEYQGYSITMASKATASKLSLNLKELGVVKTPIKLNHSSFDEFVSELKPEVVLFDRFLTEEQFGWRVSEWVPNAVRILDTEDLHSLRKTREKASKSGVEFTVDSWLSEDITKREIASVYRSDLSLIISSYEKYLLQEVMGINKDILLYLPFLEDAITFETKTNWKSFEDRQDFICIGNGKHSPNVDAIKWLKQDIWPIIRKELPEANLNIYGAYLPEFVQKMHNPEEGFLVHGWAEDKDEVFQNARLNLAPLRFGAGLKGKLIDAMKNGTPSITTQIGAEGMHQTLEWSGAIANSAENFAKAAVDLYSNKLHWLEAQENGIQIINQLFSKEKHTLKLASKLNSTIASLQAHRNTNFIGAMLKQQTTLSSKYLSKWIEEKNRK